MMVNMRFMLSLEWAPCPQMEFRSQESEFRLMAYLLSILDSVFWILDSASHCPNAPFKSLQLNELVLVVRSTQRHITQFLDLSAIRKN